MATEFAPVYAAVVVGAFAILTSVVTLYGLYLTHKFTKTREEASALAVRNREIEVTKMKAGLKHVEDMLEHVYAPIMSHFLYLWCKHEATRDLPQREVLAPPGCVDSVKKVVLDNFHFVLGPRVPREVLEFLAYCELYERAVQDSTTLQAMVVRMGGVWRVCAHRYLELKELHLTLLKMTLPSSVDISRLDIQQDTDPPRVVGNTIQGIFPPYLKGQAYHQEELVAHAQLMRMLIRMS